MAPPGPSASCAARCSSFITPLLHDCIRSTCADGALSNRGRAVRHRRIAARRVARAAAVLWLLDPLALDRLGQQIAKHESGRFTMHLPRHLLVFRLIPIRVLRAYCNLCPVAGIGDPGLLLWPQG